MAGECPLEALAFAVHLVELGSEYGCAVGIATSKKLDHMCRVGEPTRSVYSRTDTKSNVRSLDVARCTSRHLAEGFQASLMAIFIECIKA